MIGQQVLITKFKELLDNDRLPRFILLVGKQGSGKKTVSKYIATLKNCNYVYCGIKVDEVREIIQAAYTVTFPTIYIIPDADSMSLAAKNAILKVIEEPPNNAYFIMTLQDLNRTLDTIKSRGVVFYMDNYTVDEILQYTKSKYSVTKDDESIILNICETPYEVDTLVKQNCKKFMDYVQLVIDNIAEVSGANSFKIADKIALKNEEDKYDLILFWKAFMKICSDKLTQEPVKYAHAIKVTSKYLQELFITGINKQSTFDMWLLDIRSEWME